MYFTELFEALRNLPMEDLIAYQDARKWKRIYVNQQNFTDAGIYRDIEKRFEEKYELMKYKMNSVNEKGYSFWNSIDMDDQIDSMVTQIQREVKINNIINL